jgi:alpha-1,3-mannosyl-glycoprotein beta-1,2-N-acetylglucosaminyltransferase
MRRILSTPSYSQRKKKIISPWDRTVNAMTGISNHGSHKNGTTNGSNGYHMNQNGNNNNNNHHDILNRHRSTIERIAMVAILMMAWGWIMTFCGMIFYHGYQYRISSYGVGPGDTTATTTTNTIQKKLLPIIPIQEETSKHQSESRKMNQNNHQHDKLEALDTNQVVPNPALEVDASPLLIFTCQRANYLQETLSYIFKYIPSDCTICCPIIISQDGHNADVLQVIREYQTKFKEERNIVLIHMEHKSAAHVRVGANAINPYEALAIHYGWALQHVFDGTYTAAALPLFSSSKQQQTLDKTNRPVPQRVIILEEDLRIAPDFFEYFQAMAPILDKDSTLLAVSAFNDNGFVDTVKDPTRIVRSDFFPGLGWMMTRKLWIEELQTKWPSGYWDDWLREPAQRLGRQILRPEVSRTYHFGTSGGASSNQFGTQLSNVFLNDVKVDWTTIQNDRSNAHNPLYNLHNPLDYDRHYLNMINEAILVIDIASVYDVIQTGNVRLEYHSEGEFKSLVRELKVPLMDDEKAGIHRTAYKGIVETRPSGGDHLLFITPPMIALRENFSSVISTDSADANER